jgi:NAD(P)H-hydrate repair Nnr-like enzyme with NAD(P)H-hydrate dehydratase domain
MHGLAGARAAQDTGEGTTAGDVLEHLAAVIDEVRST